MEKKIGILAAKIAEMDEAQIEAALEKCTASEVKQVAQALGLKVSGPKWKQVIVIAKTCGYKDLTRRIGERPRPRNMMI